MNCITFANDGSDMDAGAGFSNIVRATGESIMVAQRAPGDPKVGPKSDPDPEKKCGGPDLEPFIVFEKWNKSRFRANQKYN